MNTSSNGYWITDPGWDGSKYDEDDLQLPTSEPMQRGFIAHPRVDDLVPRIALSDPSIDLDLACEFLGINESELMKEQKFCVWDDGDNRWMHYSTMMQIARALGT